MKLELTKGYYTEVDEEDFEWVSQWKWCASVSSDGQLVYAIRVHANQGST